MKHELINWTSRGTAHPNRIATCTCGWAYDLAAHTNPVDDDVQAAAYRIGVAVGYRWAHHVLSAQNHFDGADVLEAHRFD